MALAAGHSSGTDSRTGSWPCSTGAPHGSSSDTHSLCQHLCVLKALEWDLCTASGHPCCKGRQAAKGRHELIRSQGSAAFLPGLRGALRCQPLPAPSPESALSSLCTLCPDDANSSASPATELAKGCCHHSSQGSPIRGCCPANRGGRKVTRVLATGHRATCYLDSSDFSSFLSFT